MPELNCLRKFVEAIDERSIDADVGRAVGQFAIVSGGENKGPDITSESVLCSVQGCRAFCLLKQTPGEPGVTWTDYPENGMRCSESVKEIPEVFIRQTDMFACYPTSVAYALSRFDKMMTPQLVDEWLGREPDSYYTTEGIHAMRLSLMEAGYEILFLYPFDAIKAEDYYGPDSSLTYEDFKQASFAIKDWKSRRQWFETAYTEDVFNSDMAFRRKAAEREEPYRQNGQLTSIYGEVTSDVITELLKTYSAVASLNVFDGETDLSHAVVIEAVRTTRGDGTEAQYYSPGWGSDSRIVTDRRRQISTVFNIDQGITFIRPNQK